MKCRKSRLGDVLTLKRGHDLPSAARHEGNVPVVSSSGITGYHNEPKEKAPGVVTGRYGTLGEVFYMAEDYWPLNTALYVTDFKGTNPRFAAYFLRNVLRNYQSDKAAVPGVDRNVLHELQVFAPDSTTQEAIASILSAYDDLIENNRRRIALLEQAARLLYEEWFVRLKFPGHERTRIVNGVPEGWQKKRIGDIFDLQYGKALKEEDRAEGSVPVYGSSGIVGAHDAPLVKGPGIIVGRKGNVGSVNWSPVDFWPIDTVYYVPPEKVSLFLLHALRTANFQSSDVAVPGLNRGYAHSMPILIPPTHMRQQFEDFAGPAFAQITLLEQSNQKLRAARDLLLPRLMSGEIEV